MKLELPKVNMNMVALVGAGALVIGGALCWIYQREIYCFVMRLNQMQCDLYKKNKPYPIPGPIKGIDWGG
jgi:hypothetical protein